MSTPRPAAVSTAIVSALTAAGYTPRMSDAPDWSDYYAHVVITVEVIGREVEIQVSHDEIRLTFPNAPIRPELLPCLMYIPWLWETDYGSVGSRATLVLAAVTRWAGVTVPAAA